MNPAALAALHARAFEAPWSEAEFSTILSQSGVMAIRHAAGFLLLRVVADEAEILTLAVDPEARRRGIARALVAEAALAATSTGAVRLFLEVAEDNAAARGLYRAAGFAQAGRRRGYYARSGGPAVDALVLALELNSPDRGAFPQA